MPRCASDICVTNARAHKWPRAAMSPWGPAEAGVSQVALGRHRSLQFALPPDNPCCHHGLFFHSHHPGWCPHQGRMGQVLVLWRVTATIAVFLQPLAIGHSSPLQEGWASLMHQEGDQVHIMWHTETVTAARLKYCSQMSSSDQSCVCARAKTTAPNCTHNGTGNTELNLWSTDYQRSLLNSLPHHNLLA